MTRKEKLRIQQQKIWEELRDIETKEDGAYAASLVGKCFCRRYDQNQSQFWRVLQYDGTSFVSWFFQERPEKVEISFNRWTGYSQFDPDDQWLEEITTAQFMEQWGALLQRLSASAKELS